MNPEMMSRKKPKGFFHMHESTFLVKSYFVRNTTGGVAPKIKEGEIIL